jgi:hypothetical protein
MGKHKCIYHSNHIASSIKSGEESKKRKENRISEYNKSPRKCEYCNKDIEYNKRNTNRFCNRSCSRSYQNINRTMTNDIKTKISLSLKRIGENKLGEKISKYYLKPKKCKECGNIIFFENKNQSYCSDECRGKKWKYVAMKISCIGGNKNRNSLWYNSSIAGKVFLESSYELKVAKELDENKIEWMRPKFMFYEINNKKKRYFPDFYLIEYDIFLDPKNDFLIKQDMEKINLVQEQNNVRILILDKNLLSWDKIKVLL